MNVRQFRRTWCLVLTAAFLFSSVAGAAGPPPVFVRIKLASGSLCVYFKGEEMRIATSFKALKKADPIASARERESARGKYIYFPETPLPIPEKALPSGATGMTGTFVLQSSTSMVYAGISLSVKDKDDAEWTYKWNASKKASKSLSNAPYIKMPEFKKLSIAVVTQGNSKQKKVAVGIRFKAGNTQMTGVYKDGEEIKAHVGIVNAEGKEVTSEDGAISRYGFG